MELDKKHDLTNEEFRAGWMSKIRSGKYDVVLVTPPCSTFTRARCANMRGPPPLRTRQNPKYFPWLAQRLKVQADLGNSLVEVMVEAYQAALEAKHQL